MSRIHPRCGSKNALWSSFCTELQNNSEFLIENNDEPCWPTGRSRKNGTLYARYPHFSASSPCDDVSLHSFSPSSIDPFPSPSVSPLNTSFFRSFFAHFATKLLSFFPVSPPSSYIHIPQDDRWEPRGLSPYSLEFIDRKRHRTRKKNKNFIKHPADYLFIKKGQWCVTQPHLTYPIQCR